MEARTAFQGSGNSSNRVVAIVALLVALVLVAMGGLLVKTMNAPAATPAHQGQTGQPGTSGLGSDWNYYSRRSGTQTVEGPAAASTGASFSTKFREPDSRRGGPQS